MLSFENDYSEGAHERILRRLAETNLEKTSGYGADPYCESARSRIRAAFGCPEADVFFLAGGTQTNQVVIDSLLAQHEGVVAATTGHVSMHEAGAIEFTGHKVLELPGHEGKLDADEVRAFVRGFYADGNHEHMVFPGMVYVSWPTEYGTLYSLAELEALSDTCRDLGIPLYLDGARLGYGLAAASDVTAADIARLADVFYVGGTKVGALLGEAVVFSGRPAPAHFVTLVKQHGALLAKGRVLGIQFDELFRDGLYLKLGRNAVDRANELREALRAHGYELVHENPTNQVFVVLGNERMAELGREVRMSFWESFDAEHTVVRLATSWATTVDDVRAFADLL